MFSKTEEHGPNLQIREIILCITEAKDIICANQQLTIESKRKYWNIHWLMS
jgi:hypothetical protein